MITLVKESIAQAIQSLRANKLRSFLSLLGISIGILCIIGVQASVDSLESNVRGSLEKLGSDVIYVSKFNWVENPHENYVKILRRPDPSYQDFKFINQRLKTAESTSFHVDLGQKTLQYRSSSVERVEVSCVTYDFEKIFAMEFAKGRYFSPQEYHYGSHKIVIGHTVAEELFGAINPLGREIKVLGRKMEVIGVLEKSGDNLLDIMNFDETAIISYELGKNFVNLKRKNFMGASTISIKSRTEIPVEEVKGEVTGAMRATRQLKPREEDDFALNEVSMISNAFDSFFSGLNIMGWIIGGFALLVGLFSVANIMFVSVKERTNIIGIKKALGAKRYIILLEFLIESIILCIIGGIVGVLLISGILVLISSAIPFNISLSSDNVINAMILSTTIGVLAGSIPAFIAARMDPVTAIRSK